MQAVSEMHAHTSAHTASSAPSATRIPRSYCARGCSSQRQNSKEAVGSWPQVPAGIRKRQKRTKNKRDGRKLHSNRCQINISPFFLNGEAKKPRTRRLSDFENSTSDRPFVSTMEDTVMQTPPNHTNLCYNFGDDAISCVSFVFRRPEACCGACCSVTGPRWRLP